jgi:hypothetical protein
VKKAAATLLVTGLCTWYILSKIDLGTTGHVLAHASPGWWLFSLAIMAGSVWPMAWRWQRLLAARGVHDSLARLVRTYFVGYAAGQVLPTALGGDASRIYETVRRHQGAGAAAAGTVLLERALGGAATLVLAAVGFALAVGRYDVGGYLWVELAFVVGAALLEPRHRVVRDDDDGDVVHLRRSPSRSRIATPGSASAIVTTKKRKPVAYARSEPMPSEPRNETKNDSRTASPFTVTGTSMTRKCSGPIT